MKEISNGIRPTGCRAPPPLPLHVGMAGRNNLNEEILPLPTEMASDIAKPYQIFDTQRCCADVNSPYKRKC
jgi:hypothetical protein